jgi:perosamine synthetase
MTAVPLTRVEMDEREYAAVRRVLESGWITLGPETAAFEAAFAAAVRARHAVAVSSGTAALHLALLAVGVEPGDEVITVSYSFIATVDAVRMAGARPVLVDIDGRTGNIDASIVDAAISPRTRAILCVHQTGMPCDVSALSRIARARGLRLVEDAACAAGSEVLWDGNWERIGRPHGDAACFSFHPRKVLTTGDGGMVTTNSDGLNERLRLLRMHGMTIPAHDRHVASCVSRESYAIQGFNYRMTDIQAAIGRVQVSRLDDILTRRRALAERYHEWLRTVPGVTTPYDPTWARSNWQSYLVRLDDDIDRTAVAQRLLDVGIATRPGVMCAHREPAYPPHTWRLGSASLTESERLQDHGLILPLFPQMTEADQRAVVDALSAACAR